MRVEIWSDVVCPWCYIGKRRLEQALAAYAEDHPAAEPVEVVLRSFELDPGSPREATETVAEHLGRKYGGGAEAGRQMIDRVREVAAGDGLDLRLADARRANTLDAHRLLHLARAEGRQLELGEELFRAHFSRAEDVSDHEVLLSAVRAAGVDEVRAKDVLASDAYAGEVRADVAQATAYGATGVPFFVVDSRYGVSGAQPADVLRQVLDRAWSDAHPGLEVLTGDGADDACGPDGCAI